MYLIELIDKGHIKEAKERINLELDDYILSIDYYMKEEKNLSKEYEARVKRLLARIAKNRKEYPFQLKESENFNELNEANILIHNSLNEALSEENKK